jgi:hypothetical protein
MRFQRTTRRTSVSKGCEKMNRYRVCVRVVCCVHGKLGVLACDIALWCTYMFCCVKVSNCAKTCTQTAAVHPCSSSKLYVVSAALQYNNSLSDWAALWAMVQLVSSSVVTGLLSSIAELAKCCMLMLTAEARYVYPITLICTCFYTEQLSAQFSLAYASINTYFARHIMHYK